MDDNHELATRVFIIWTAFLLLALGLFVAARSCVIRTGQAFIASAGPGNADYGMDIIQGYSLIRAQRDARLIVSPDGIVQVDKDVTGLGWDSRFIVCCQGPYWWVIDTADSTKHGPLDESQCRALLEQLEPGTKIQTYPTPEGRGARAFFGSGPLYERTLQP